MSRKSIIARNEKRIKLAKKHMAKRNLLKQEGRWDELQKLPRNSLPCRIRNRCFVTGRGRGYLRDFGCSRIVLREQTLKGNIPGIRKSSW